LSLRYLLDTNILSALIRQPSGAVAAHIEKVGEDAVCTSLIVAAELRFGARKKGSRKLVDRVERVLDSLDILALESPADNRYAELRHALERAGTPIGPNDMLIAAHALALGLVLVTDNTREFARVRGLKTENWLAP
jgi:tRNA(fMet)-specific endonuclease VapC